MSWLDDWAKSSARPARTGSDGISRRQMLKRVGVVAGVAWTAPLIQSATAPAYAYNTCTTGCGPGFPCGPGITCGSPTSCVNGVCANKGWYAESCNGGGNCYSGTCTGGTCAKGAAGTPCRATVDCTTGVICAANHVCGGPGASCTTNGQCASNNCNTTTQVCN